MKTIKIPKGYIKRTSGEHSHIEDGASVYINPSYVGKDESPKKYFVCELSDGFALIANTKKELNNGEGRIYGLYSFEDYFNFSEVLAYDINNGLFINAGGDTVYFCHKSGAYWFVQLYGTPEEAAEYQAELFRAKNYCG